MSQALQPQKGKTGALGEAAAAVVPLSGMSGLIDQATHHAINGFSLYGVKFGSAEDLIAACKKKASSKDREAMIETLIKEESGKTFLVGFGVGFGGFVTLPLAIPTLIIANFFFQARLVASIAMLRGYSPTDEAFKTGIVMAVLGGSTSKVLKKAAAKLIEDRLKAYLLRKISEKVVSRLIPGLSSVIGGAIDGTACVGIGKVAKRMFN